MANQSILMYLPRGNLLRVSVPTQFQNALNNPVHIEKHEADLLGFLSFQILQKYLKLKVPTVGNGFSKCLLVNAWIFA